MTDAAVSGPEDPRRPQGGWPGVIFILGILATLLITCSQSGTKSTAIPSASPAQTAAAPTAPAAAPASAPAAAPAISTANLSDAAKAILAKLGASPSVSACQDGFTALMRAEPVSFKHNSTTLSESAQTALNGAAAIATICKAYKIEIGGHTSRSGPRAVNQRVSEARANAVKDYLTGNGAQAAGLSAKGYGESQAKGRGARDRRIGFTVSA